jgi:hypothetical protein
MLRAMPEIDLKPDEYRKQDKSGRWYVPDDPKVGRLVFFGCLAILGALYFLKSGISQENLFWSVLIFAAAAGGAFYMWLKDVA